MLKQFVRLAACIALFSCTFTLQAASQNTTTATSSSKEAQIKDIDQQIAVWQSIQTKYKNKEYVAEDEADRIMDEDWLQYRQDMKNEQTDEDVVQFIQKKIDALQKQKDALMK